MNKEIVCVDFWTFHEAFAVVGRLDCLLWWLCGFWLSCLPFIKFKCWYCWHGVAFLPKSQVHVMCFNMFTIFEAFTDLKYHFKGHIKAHLRSFRHICTHIEALFFCRHNNTSVAVSINSSFQQIFALLSPKYTQCRNPLALATRLKGAKASSPTVVAAASIERHTVGTHTLAAASVHTRFQ